ncbi:MerR family transcriptional regulator [Anaerococcus sp. AGMB00486]|uniref:MerR family transcriptional regulator n=1 Tax=Anaerococcus faecalis TaxID=2742993 RepID=A0ABX2NCP8_9FIRM|nr:MerR family transcriptional regulator [Anaerococcus faecalis]NVF12385.1 MerR family transcriptional regulator [Anaerococcus faecalis]
MKYMSINEFAEKFNVSRQTLIYYDKVGLFKPEYVDINNGYRYYSYNQFSQFSFIKFLRNLDFSIGKIKKMLEEDDVELIKKDLDKKRNEIIEESRRLIDLSSIIDSKLDFIETKNNEAKSNIFNIVEIPKRYYYSLGYEDNIYNNNLFFNYPTIVIYTYKKDKESYNKIFGALVSKEDIREEYRNYLKEIQISKSLVSYFKGPYNQIPNYIKKIRGKFDKLKLNKDFVCLNIVDPFLEKNPQKYITEIQIPINS